MTSDLRSATTRSTGSASGVHRFFAADDFDACAKFALGHAGQGTIDIGTVLSTLADVTDGDPVSWHREWCRTADVLRDLADTSRASDSTRSAAGFYLAAAEAYDQSLSFVDGTPDGSVLLPTFRQHRACWDAFVTACEGRHLPLSVPYEGTEMPGYLFRPDDSGAPRPTVVVTNGSDGSLAGLWSTVIRGGLERGWNVFVFDGPGQQSMLFERDIPFRFDWEAVLTPVTDLLVARPDVDPSALLAYGISQGGYWLPRALAFEHRYVAAVVDGGVVDVSRTWYAHLPAELLALLQAGEKETFDGYLTSAPSDPQTEREAAFRARPYGQRSPFDLFTEVGRYRLTRDLLAHITTPMLVTDPADDQYFPGQSRELFDGLTGPKALLRLDDRLGAMGHCEPLARGAVNRQINDFWAGFLSRET